MSQLASGAGGLPSKTRRTPSRRTWSPLSAWLGVVESQKAAAAAARAAGSSPSGSIPWTVLRSSPCRSSAAVVGRSSSSKLSKKPRTAVSVPSGSTPPSPHARLRKSSGSFRGCPASPDPTTQSTAENHLCVVPWRLGDGAAVGALGGWAGGGYLVAADQLAEDDGHLELGEGGAEAAADAAAEGDPGVGAGRVVEEALGEEPLGFGVDLRVAVDQVDAGDDPGAGRQLVAAELDRLGQLADHDHDHRAQPQ